MRSLQCNRSGSIGVRIARVQLEPNTLHPRACVYERNVQTSVHRSAPTTHRNREHPDIFLALDSTTVFSVMDDRKKRGRGKYRGVPGYGGWSGPSDAWRFAHFSRTRMRVGVRCWALTEPERGVRLLNPSDCTTGYVLLNPSD